jgi:hypothetical protein
VRSLPRGIRLSIRLAGDVERDEQAQVAKSGMLIDVEYTAAAHARNDYRDNWAATTSIA